MIDVTHEAVVRWAERRRAAIAAGVVSATESDDFWRGYTAALDDLGSFLTARAQNTARRALEEADR